MASRSVRHLAKALDATPMPSRIPQFFFIATLSTSALAVVGTGIYMAQPWGGNYAYQDATGYARLGVILLFAIAPYFALLLCNKLFSAYERVSRFFAICASLIGLAGMAAYLDATFIHIDAQSGMIFLILPIIQIAASFALVVICALWIWLTRVSEAAK